jgi:hypothetical protein
MIEMHALDTHSILYLSKANGTTNVPPTSPSASFAMPSEPIDNPPRYSSDFVEAAVLVFDI